MEHQNTKEQLEELRSKSKSSYKYFAYTVIGLSVFIGSMYWTIEDGKQKVAQLKNEKEDLIYSQQSECRNLKWELEGLVRKDTFQELYKNQQANTQEGVFMYSINESNTATRQLEITNSLDAVCTKNNKRIEEIESELNRIASSFAH